MEAVEASEEPDAEVHLVVEAFPHGAADTVEDTGEVGDEDTHHTKRMVLNIASSVIDFCE